MHLISVNIGESRPTDVGSVGHTGIYKEASPDAVFVGSLGLKGDTVCDDRYHGGPDQAVYIYTQPDYLLWNDEIGFVPPPGSFGENLTVTDLESQKVSVGDRLVFTAVILEVTAPRIPCSTLAAKMNDPTFVKRFKNAELPGFYCRVIRDGSVTVGDSFRYEPATPSTVTLMELFVDYYSKDASPEAIQRFLGAPISTRTRVKLEGRLSDSA